VDKEWVVQAVEEIRSENYATCIVGDDLIFHTSDTRIKKKNFEYPREICSIALDTRHDSTSDSLTWFARAGGNARVTFAADDGTKLATNDAEGP
jgi:hypothetical protein